MNALAVGGAVALVMAGPPLYGMVQNGQLDSASAIGRGLLVAGACAAGASYVLSLVRDYELEGQRTQKRKALLKALAEAEEAAQRHTDATAKAAAVEAEAAARKSS